MAMAETFATETALHPSSFTTGASRPKAFESSFTPVQPHSLADMGLAPKDLFPLILRRLFLHGDQSGLEISKQLRLPFGNVEPVLSALKTNQLIAHKASAANNDFVFELLPKGAEQARLAIERSTYCGAAPVSIEEYNASVIRQSLKNFHPTMPEVQHSFSDLVLSKLLIAQVGQAVSSGKSMFLYGAPGNGKSQIAKRVIRAIDPIVWIPRALSIGGEVIRIFDPSVHKEVPLPENECLSIDEPIDSRWVRIERPFISVGGELTPAHLEASINPITNIIEAPIHIKSNCGCLAIEDLGRQQISVRELLNRWIVPMGEGHDFVNLPSGRQIRLPFDQLLIFTTNLDPNQLCDEAFMRRMPYKIEVCDPTESQFRQLFELRRQQYGFEFQNGIVDYLIEYFYKRKNRPFRFCHVDDLLGHARDFCTFHEVPLVLNRDVLEMAILNYFSGTESVH